MPNRRGFLAALCALPLAPFVKLPAPVPAPFSLDAHITKMAAALAADIDRRAVQQLMFHRDAFCLHMASFDEGGLLHGAIQSFTFRDDGRVMVPEVVKFGDGL